MLTRDYYVMNQIECRETETEILRVNLHNGSKFCADVGSCFLVCVISFLACSFMGLAKDNGGDSWEFGLACYW